MKNIPKSEVLSLAAQVEARPGQVVSKTLVQNDAVSMTLFAFAAGEEISTHTAPGDAMITVLEGTGRITLDGVPHVLHEGQTIVMPAGAPHALYAEEAFRMQLTVFYPEKKAEKGQKG